ncbi:MAG: sensor histidine kinase [Actinomycetota bacterium]
MWQNNAQDNVQSAEEDDELATIIHELKTPITSMIGYSRMLRANFDRLSKIRREECFEQIERQGRRMLHMIEDLLESKRLDAQEPRLSRSALDIQAVVKHAVGTVNGLVENHLIIVDVPDRNLGVFGDALAIEHAITNLIENAVKHSPLGSTVSVRVREHSSEVRIEVSDDGPGIAADDIPHVFERFRRASSTSRGAGLGLYIVRGLIAAHGGRVWVESIHGQGTTFTIALPRRSQVSERFL